MVLIHSLRKDLTGMNNTFKPKGRRAIPDELINFGRHLVYSEGTKTEPFYVESIKKAIAEKYNCEANAIEIINGTTDESFNTIGLIKYGEKDIKKRMKNGEIINHVWFFFDHDEFVEQNYIKACKYENKINNSEKENFEGFKYNKENHITYHCCWSNESFELWLYLYFEYNDSKLTRNDYVDKLQKLSVLKQIKFNYKKNSEDIHQIFTSAGGSIEKAIASAKKLTIKNEFNNPSTAIWKFAEYFKPYMKKR